MALYFTNTVRAKPGHVQEFLAASVGPFHHQDSAQKRRQSAWNS